MRVSNVDIMEQMKKNKDLAIIYACAIASSIILILGWGVQEAFDSSSYINAWDSFVNGRIDMFRTPVYPVFLGAMKIILGEQFFCMGAICVQHIIFLFSLRYFYRLALTITNSGKIAFWITLFYGVFSCITTWNNFILTESFAISGTVFILYLVQQLSEKRSFIYALHFTILLSLLVLLRPALIYMLPVFGVVWILMAIKNRKKMVALSGILSVAVSSLSLLAYMKAFEKEYGIFASSSVSTINQVCIAHDYDLLNAEVIEDPQLRKDIIDPQFKKDILEHRLWDRYDLKTINDAIMASNKSQPMKYIQKCFGRLYRSSTFPLFLTSIPGITTIKDMIGISLGTLYLFLIIYTIIIIYWSLKKRMFPPITALMYMLGVSNIIVSIVGAQAEWSRLILPSFPLFLLMFEQVCTIFVRRPILDVDFR